MFRRRIRSSVRLTLSEMFDSAFLKGCTETSFYHLRLYTYTHAHPGIYIYRSCQFPSCVLFISVHPCVCTHTVYLYIQVNIYAYNYFLYACIIISSYIATIAHTRTTVFILGVNFIKLLAIRLAKVFSILYPCNSNMRNNHFQWSCEYHSISSAFLLRVQFFFSFHYYQQFNFHAD